MNRTDFFLKLLISCIFLNFVYLLPQGFAQKQQALPTGWEKIKLEKMLFKVIDGDTFDADLNRNKKLSKSKERIRLLYVDTPELSKSHKGQNRKLGLSAKKFLISALSAKSQILWIDPENKIGNYGRLLGILQTDGRNQNLALIAEGHSYFDTRFGWPEDFKTYARAESKAFEKHHGIWSNNSSRKHYLLRLRKEGKTVYSKRNPFFVAKIQTANSINLSKFNGRFIRVKGMVKNIKILRKGAQLVYLQHNHYKKGLPIITFENQRKWLGIESLQKGNVVQIEGFSENYKNRQWQIKLHRAIIF